MAKVLKGIVIGAVGIVTLLSLTVLIAVNMFGSQVGQLIQQLGQFGVVEEVDRSQPVLLKSVQEVGQFHSAVGNFQEVIDIEEDVTWLPEFIAGRRTLFIGVGTVNSYIDLSGLAEDELTLSADGKTATIRLPEAQLDKPNLDLDESYFADQDRGIIDRVVDAFESPEQAQFHKLAETRLATAAEASDLRNQATENTKAMLTGMLGALDMDVIFEERR